ncbi:rhomboid family intramembrane serine protease [Candidatus Bipolaricaulota bacterium]
MIPIRDSLPSRRFPVVTVSLIVLNLLVFLYQGYLQTRPVELNDGIAWQNEGLTPPPAFNPVSYRAHLVSGGDPGIYPVSASDYFVSKYALIAAELLRGTDLPPTIPIPLWLTVLTSMFLHGGLMHLLGNMLYLWIFGDNVEDAMGPIRFLVFYLLCGAAAAFAQIAVDPGSTIPLIGASGAIAGVLAAYFMLFPYAKVVTLIPIFFFLRLMSIPAVFLLGFWFLLQVISGAGSLGSGGGVAWFAHIGGFIAGAILVFPFRRRGVPVALWQRLRRGRT